MPGNGACEGTRAHPQSNVRPASESGLSPTSRSKPVVCNLVKKRHASPERKADALDRSPGPEAPAASPVPSRMVLPTRLAVGRVPANGVLAPRVEKRRAGIPPLSPGARGQRHPSACSLTSPLHRLVRTHLPGSMTKGFLPLLSSLSPGWSMLSV